MAHNTGQCLPVNIIAQEFMEYVEEHNLNPENTIFGELNQKDRVISGFFRIH